MLLELFFFVCYYYCYSDLLLLTQLCNSSGNKYYFFSFQWNEYKKKKKNIVLCNLMFDAFYYIPHFVWAEFYKLLSLLSIWILRWGKLIVCLVSVARIACHIIGMSCSFSFNIIIIANWWELFVIFIVY